MTLRLGDTVHFNNIDGLLWTGTITALRPDEAFVRWSDHTVGVFARKHWKYLTKDLSMDPANPSHYRSHPRESGGMKVDLIAATDFRAALAELLTGWNTDADGGQALAEFAGRSCYESWSKPHAKTATNAGYLHHILEVGHLSVLEHASATFYVQGVSRSLTHELIRHRHLSFSQLSQRYVDESDTEFATPPMIADSDDERLLELFTRTVLDARHGYELIVEKLAQARPDASRKEVRQAARAVLPNATETKIVVTGNYRAWRHFIDLRATEAADVEIRQLAVEVLRQLRDVAPNVFGDYSINALPDRTVVAASPYAEAS